MDLGTVVIIICLLLFMIMLVESTMGLQRQAFIKDDVVESEVDLSGKDFASARFVPNDQPSYTQKLYRRDRFEGDIDIRDGRVDVFRTAPYGKDSKKVHYNAVRNAQRKWPDGRIPYKISSRYTDYSRARIAAAMREYDKNTCIRFVPRKREHDYLYIFPDDGCYSLVGLVGGRQDLSLEEDCIHKGIIMHELMHTVGFFHEQSRPDRDDYVDIIWENIIPGVNGQFGKYSRRTIDNLGISYDYGSIMHYSAYAFTRNGLPTVVPKGRKVYIGQRKRFSRKDLRKIKRLYQCNRSRMKAVRRRDKSTEKEDEDSSASCIDRTSLCERLAASGKCNKKSTYMSKNCRRTCKKCDS